MCDRSKAEVLAREYCATYYRGILNGRVKFPDPKTRFAPTEEYVDENWSKWKDVADIMLEVLEEHE